VTLVALSDSGTVEAGRYRSRLRVLGGTLVSASAVTVRFDSAGTAISGAMSVDGVLTLPRCERGWFATAEGQSLDITLGASVSVQGYLEVVEDVVSRDGGILDGLGYTAYAARGFSLLTEAWRGNAVCRLREDGGDTEADFLADTGRLLSSTGQTVDQFRDGNSVFVDTLYDQTGNSRDLTQTVNASQPGFTETGFAGNPACTFDGSQYLIGEASGGVTGNDTPFTGIISHTIDAPWDSAVKMAWQFSHSSNADPFIAVLRSVTSDEFQTARRATSAGGAETAAWTPIGEPSVTVVRQNGTTVDVWFNGVRKYTAQSFNVNSMTLNQETIGASRVGTTTASAFLEGMVAETILFDQGVPDSVVDVFNS